ncbi:hypothetical protein [Streptomyces cucumeris]|uniref:hypothetical protein n=1 Tax=Streptomyces cucumeris TaxID=2962890 RepID=UPI003EC051EF
MNVRRLAAPVAALPAAVGLVLRRAPELPRLYRTRHFTRRVTDGVARADGARDTGASPSPSPSPNGTPPTTRNIA